jgi:hypothetical protein
MYYPSNDGRLFMGQSVTVPLPIPGSDTFEEVPLTGAIGLPSYSRTTAGFNVTNDGVRRSLGGKIADQVIEGNLVPDWDEDVHQDFFADAKAAQAVTRNWRIDYAGGRVANFRGFVTSWAEEAITADDEVRESRVNWSISVDGEVTWTNAP